MIPPVRTNSTTSPTAQSSRSQAHACFSETAPLATGRDAVRATCVSDYNLVFHAGLPLEVDLPNVAADRSPRAISAWARPRV